MYTNDELKSAVTAGVISEQTHQALEDYLGQLQQHKNSEDEEHFRLLSGFNDIFVVIASVLVLAALWSLGNLTAPWLGGAFTAVGAWGLAEYFTRIKRMALPSIVLLVFCLGGVFFGTAVSLAQIYPDSPYIPFYAFISSAVVAFAHWHRFQVPITVAAVAATIVGICISAIAVFFTFSEDLFKAGLFIAGIIVFALALYWDKSDIKRQTRRSDVAFWLHLLAAPLLVHPVFSSLAGLDSGAQQAVMTIALYLFLSLISLIIDRRALMVSALAYVVYVFSRLLDGYGLVDISTAVIGLVIGSGLLLLAVYWHPVRVRILKWLPLHLQSVIPSAS